MHPPASSVSELFDDLEREAERGAERELWQRVLRVARTVIEALVFDEEADASVASVRPREDGGGRIDAHRLRTVGAIVARVGVCLTLPRRSGWK